jgi:hypothetical protein
MSEAAVSAGGTPGGALAPGQVVGGRFELVEAVGDDALGTVWKARDQKTKKGIALRVLAASLLSSPEAIEVLRAEVKIASALAHKNLVTTFGMGVEKSGIRFVACEWLEGKTVAELRTAPQRLPLAQIVDLVGQLCDALGAMHGKTAAHGTLRASVVWIANGRLKLSEVGVGRALLKTAGAATLGAADQQFLAPEVRAGQAASVAGDVFGVGGILYALCTGRSAADDFVPPSSAHPEGKPELDQVLLKCLAADPAARFGSTAELKTALGMLVGASGDGIDIDIDVEEAARKSRLPPAPRPTGAAPQIGERVSIHEDFRPSLMGSGAMGSPVGAGPGGGASALVDLSSLLSKITENDAARWMAQIDGLDHGPLSGRELVAMIAKGEVKGEHGLLNMDTGERKKVRDYPEFLEFVEQYRLKAAAQAEVAAIGQAAKTEKASNTAKFLIAGAVLGVVGLGVAVFFITRGAERDHTIAGADMADLYERGDVQIEGTAGILPDPPRGSGHRTHHTGGGGGGSGRSYEDAMNDVVDLGSAAGSGGEGRLSPGTVAGVMNGRINSFFPCVGAELRSGGSLGRVRIDLAIAGNGSVLGSSVHVGSGTFQSCVQRVVGGIHFPSFSAPRMGASYTFDASQ